MGPDFERGFNMVLKLVYKDSELGAHTRGPEDLLWTSMGL